MIEHPTKFPFKNQAPKGVNVAKLGTSLGYHCLRNLHWVLQEFWGSWQPTFGSDLNTG